MKRSRFYVTLAVLCSVNFISAKVKLPAILADNMVLQQQTNVRLWGKANPNSVIKVLPSWLNKSVTGNVDNEGNWMVQIKTPEAGGPYTITFDDGDSTEKLCNILTGEVWLCSGQSNMEMPIKGFYSQPVIGSTQIIANANPKIPIRLFSVKKEISNITKDDVIGQWSENTSAGVKEFSATAYFFGKQLYNTLNVPIGLIHTSWGGSNIEAWMPEDLIKLFPDISLEHLKSKTDNLKSPQQAACLLHNAMLYPLRNMNIKGIIWYQGEANRFKPEQYEKLMVSFVDYLRSIFNDKELPFYYTQIAPFRYGNSNGEEGAALREAQLHCESIIPNSGMAVLMDAGEEMCIHPSNKNIPGERLAYIALNKSYNLDIPAFSPKYYSKKIENDKIILSFKNADLGLTSFGKKLSNFEISDDRRVFVEAQAVIQGNKVKVWSDKIKKPVAVRYGYKNFVVGDLFGTNGLPVSSFKTDF